MQSLVSPTGGVLLGVLLLGAAVVIGMSPGPRERTQAGVPTDQRKAMAGSKGTTRSGPASSRWERGLRGRSLRDVRKLLPTTVPANHLEPAGREEWLRSGALFRRFGELAGEDALDEIADRYGPSRFTVDAMTEAIIGWMAVDRAAALAALDSLMRSTPLGPLQFGMAWKGTLLLSGLG